MFGRSEDFIRHNNRLLNENIIAMQLEYGVSTWFALRIDILSILLMATLSIVCVLLRGDVEED